MDIAVLEKTKEKLCKEKYDFADIMDFDSLRNINNLFEKELGHVCTTILHDFQQKHQEIEKITGQEFFPLEIKDIQEILCHDEIMEILKASMTHVRKTLDTSNIAFTLELLKVVRSGNSNA